jgi:hypothetical protein
VLHRHSVGVLASSAAFPSHGPRFRYRLDALRSSSDA